MNKQNVVAVVMGSKLDLTLQTEKNDPQKIKRLRAFRVVQFCVIMSVVRKKKSSEVFAVLRLILTYIYVASKNHLAILLPKQALTFTPVELPALAATHCTSIE